MDLQQTRPCNGEKCGGNIYTSAYDLNNNNDMFNNNFEEPDLEQNLFTPTKFERKPFRTDQQRPVWNSPDIEEDQSSYHNPISGNTNFNYDNSNIRSQVVRPFNPTTQNEDNPEEFVSVNNIYGNEKLVGTQKRRPYEEEQTEATNLFGDLESSYNNDNKRLTNNRKSSLRPTKKYGLDTLTGTNIEEDLFNKRPGFSNSRNTFTKPRDPYGYKTIESMEAEQNDHFCLQKPIASPQRCTKKRLIVKNYWFYDADDGECKIFTADNCDENKNKFFSMEKCLETCGQFGARQEENQEEELPYNRRDYGRRVFGETPQTSHRGRWN